MEVGTFALVVDTNALSAIADNRDRIKEVLATAAVIAVPVISLGEYRFGIAQSRNHAHYTSWLERFLHDSRVLEINQTTTSFYAEIALELKQAGRPIPSNDVWIASLCRQHNLPLLSRDRHFDFVRNIRRVSW